MTGVQTCALPIFERRRVLPDEAAKGLELHELEIRLDADLRQVADRSLGVFALAVSVDIRFEAVGKTRLGQKLLGFRGIVVVAGHVLGAAEMGGIPRRVDDLGSTPDEDRKSVV